MGDPTAHIDDLEDGEIESDGEENNEKQIEEKKEIISPANKITDNVDYEETFYTRPGKKKKSKSHKGEQRFKDKSKKNKKLSNPIEEDFAGTVEKAIRKAMNKNDDNEVHFNDVDERRKSKKRKKYDGKDGSSRKRKKQDFSEDMDESEMMCVRGASPVQRNSPNDNYEDDNLEEEHDYESESSEDGHNHQSRQQRQRPRDRKNNNKNDRDRRRGVGAHPMQDPDGVCLYYMQGKCHKGDDCMYSHDAQPPRKMELCKFYLMDCCAKRDKCLYMHADFPCKYYHTGLPCIYKDECKFAHGKPLSEALKNILLKHIESAPKEILGDFPRLNREGALKMIQTTQTKLMQQYPDSIESQDKSIPSLFDLNIPRPQNVPEPNPGSLFTEKQCKISPKVRQSRWQNDNSAPTASNSLSPNSNVSSSNILSIKNLTGVLTPRQITDLTKMGIDNLDQLGQLTVIQLNSIGISLKQITEIQLNTMNIQKLGLIYPSNEQLQPPAFIPPLSGSKDLDYRVPPLVSCQSASITPELPEKDIDMRFQPSLTLPNMDKPGQVNNELVLTQPNKDMIDIDQYTKDALKFALTDKENIDISNDTFENDKPNRENLSLESKDVDHRVLPFSETDKSSQPSVDYGIKNETDTDIRFLQPDPIFKSPAKRNRRSTTDDDDENNLLIDEKWYSSDEEKNHKKKSPVTSPQLSSPPQTPAPHVIEPSALLSKIGDLSKIDISDEVTKLLNTMKNNLQETPAENKLDKSRDPRSRRSPEPKNDSNKLPNKKSNRISIYECVDGEPTDGRRRSDVDLRQPDYKMPAFGDTDLRQGSSGDIDFRLGLPFKPLPNYTPASEIDGSINSHPPITYKLMHIDIPRPDYTDIRNSTAKSQALVDPRLRKVFRLSIDESNSDSEKPPAKTSNAPLVDPRRKPKDIETPLPEQKSSLDLQVVIQNSDWYKDLSSTQKIFTNQQIASVTSMIKKFQQDKTPGKKLDTAAINSNTILVSIFTNLGVALGENGEFSYLPKPKEALLKTPVGFNQNIPYSMNNSMTSPMEGNNMNMMNLHNTPMGMGMGHMNNMGMGNMPGFNPNYPDPRGGPAPGLLGIAPNIPHNYNKFSGPNNFGNRPFNGPINDFGMDGDQNFHRFNNRGGHRGRGNERWNRGGGGRGGNRERKNFNDRGNWKNDRQ